MSETNFSCMVLGPKKAKFEHRPVPVIEDPHQVLVRISYVGVCGSDVHFWNAGGLGRKVSEEHPVVMGHEASGLVDAVGPAVTSVKAGDRVAIEPGCPCRRCKQCKAGLYNLCSKMQFAADPPYHGTLSRLYRTEEDFVYKIPDQVSLQEAVLVEPLAVAVHGNRLAGLKPGQTVLVLGSGTIGLLAAAVARAFGAKTLCLVDINQDKLNFAKSFVGCDTFVPDLKATPEENATRFRAETNQPDGVDVVLECTGVESSAQTGIYASGAGATFVQIGMGKALMALPMLTMCDRETVVKAAFRYGAGDYELALELMAAGKVEVKPLISTTVPFEKAPEAWEMTGRGEGIKNLIQGVQD